PPRVLNELRRRAVEPAALRLEPAVLVENHLRSLAGAGELVLRVVVHAERAALAADFRVLVGAELIERTLRPVPLLPAVRDIEETRDLPLLKLERGVDTASPIRIGIADDPVGDVGPRKAVSGEVDRALGRVRTAQRVDVTFDRI